MNRSDYLNNKWLKHVTGEEVYTPPTEYWVGLSAVDFTSAGSGAELSGNGYGRIQISWNPVSANTVTAVEDPEFLADGGEWTIKGRGIFDAEVGGNLLYFQDLSVAETIADGQSYRLTAILITAN